MIFFSMFVYIVLSLGCGVFFIAWSCDIFDFSLSLRYPQEVMLIQQNAAFDLITRVVVLLVGVLIVLLCLKYLQAVIFRARRERSITFDSAEGEVSVTLFAIEDMVRRLLDDKTELSHVRPKVSARKKGIQVLIRSHLSAEVNLIDFIKDVQEKIKEKLETILGEEKEIKVKIEIKKMVFPGGKVRDEEPEIPFRNY